MLADLQGQIERITYRNEENGYTVAKLNVPGRMDLVTIEGNLFGLMPGEALKIWGQWVTHPEYGEQFKIVHYKTALPATVYGIEKYLGYIKGIGPVMAKRIVNKFGKETLNVIEENIENFKQVVGEKRIGLIKEAWDKQKEIREVMIFLQAHGLSSGYATKIFKHYGDRPLQVVKKNPYRLTTDFGIAFITADRIAEKLGFAKDSGLRSEAGILYVLYRLADGDHPCYPYEPFVKKCEEFLGVESDVILILKGLGRLAIEEKLFVEEINQKKYICLNYLIEQVEVREQTREADFPKKFYAPFRATDGHYVRSKAEMLVDNWLYKQGIIHEYERRLPAEESVITDFYLPHCKVYIEYWGLLDDIGYRERKNKKIAVYRKHNLKLLELTDDDIHDLDRSLSRKLSEFGVLLEQ